MTTAVARILSQVEKLPPRQRAQVALASLRMVDQKPAESPAKLRRTVAERADEVRSGKAKGYPLEEVMKELRRKYN